MSIVPGLRNSRLEKGFHIGENGMNIHILNTETPTLLTSASFPHLAPTMLFSVLLPHRAVGVLSEKSYQFQKKMPEETDIKRFQQASCLRTEPTVKSFPASLGTPLLYISSEGLPNIWEKWHMIQKKEIWSYARERKIQGNYHPWKRTENITRMKQGLML